VEVVENRVRFKARFGSEREPFTKFTECADWQRAIFENKLFAATVAPIALFSLLVYAILLVVQA